MKGGDRILLHKNKCIVIAGYGPLGVALAKSLYEKGRKAVVLDKDRESFRYLPKEFRGYEVEGGPADPQVPEAVGIEDAGLFTAPIRDDNTNLLLAQTTSRIFHMSQVYARLDNIRRHQLVTDLPAKPIGLYDLSADDYGRLVKTMNREVAVWA